MSVMTGEKRGLTLSENSHKQTANVPSTALSRNAGVRVGIVGCGYWGSKHVRVLSATVGVGGIALIDPNESLRSRLRLAFPAGRSYRNLKSALPHVDPVVATPPQTHAEIALAAMREGKHVLIEKPIATNTRSKTPPSDIITSVKIHRQCSRAELCELRRGR